MADYLPPTGPPPPQVPAGWKAVYNDQYKEWYAAYKRALAADVTKLISPTHLASIHNSFAMRACCFWLTYRPCQVLRQSPYQTINMGQAHPTGFWRG